MFLQYFGTLYDLGLCNKYRLIYRKLMPKGENTD